MLKSLFAIIPIELKTKKKVVTGNVRGKLIVLEGLDGSGKGTQIRLLSDYIRSTGRQAYLTAEPTSSSLGGMIRDALGGFVGRDAYELSALFLADRIFHNVNPRNGIRKFLDEGIDVICDRYYYSSFAYQGTDADLDWVMRMNLDCREITAPDLCIFLDVDTEQCDKRIAENRFDREIYENIEMQRRIRARFFEVFARLKDSDPIRIVDASRQPEAVSEDVIRLYQELVTKEGNDQSLTDDYKNNR